MADKPIEQWTRKECEEYLEKYPKSLESDNVRKRYAFFKDELKKEAEADNCYWEKNKNTTLGISEYMLKYKKGLHINECDDAYWKLAKSTLIGLQNYKKLFPQGKHISEYEKQEKTLKQERNKTRNEQIDKTIGNIKVVIKYAGLAFCVFVAIGVVYAAITTEYKITAAGIAPLAYAFYTLSKWNV